MGYKDVGYKDILKDIGHSHSHRWEMYFVKKQLFKFSNSENYLKIARV